MSETTPLADVMIQPPLTVSPETPVKRAARLMEQFGCPFLPVVRNGRAIGVVTASDLALRALASDDSPEAAPVSRFMSAPAVGLPSDAEIEDASILMRRANVKRLVVHDAHGRLVGVVGLCDLADYMEDASVAKTIRKLGDTCWGYSGAPLVRARERA